MHFLTIFCSSSPARFGEFLVTGETFGDSVLTPEALAIQLQLHNDLLEAEAELNAED